MEPVSLSARRLAEYVHRSGSIDAAIGSANAMMEGTRIHQAIQKTYGEEDEKEKFLSRELDLEGKKFILEGRCDGLLKREDGYIVDEIKSTSRQLEDIESPAEVHQAQAFVYAWILTEELALESIGVQVTYVQSSTHEEKRFTESYSASFLEEKVIEMVRIYEPFALLMQRLKDDRQASIETFSFPFDSFRPGQRKLAGAVYKTIDEKAKLFAQAPTGIGKTISTLFPAIKAAGEGKVNQIVYTTAKTTTRIAAEEAFGLMESKGLKMSAVSMTAKDKICFKEKTICQKEYCEFADGHFDRINGAMMDILEHETLMTRKVIEAYAMKHRVCPFEFSMDLSYLTDAMIGDYNYVFDPRVSRKRMAGEQKSRAVLLVDEAHNLPDRASSMYSASLMKAPFLQLSRNDQHPSLQQAAKSVNKAFLEVKKGLDESFAIVHELPEEWLEAVQVFYSEAERLVQSGVRDEQIIEQYFAVRQLIAAAEQADERFYTYIQKMRNDVLIKIVCMDPSAFIQGSAKGYRASVFFSATLQPVSYIRTMLGGEQEDFNLDLPSPFAKEQIEVKKVAVSTKYKDREATIKSITDELRHAIERHSGNFMIFFPSYAYMKMAYEYFEEEGVKGVELMMQSSGMGEAERDEFLAAFKSGERIAAFAVLGGVFSEGVDLPGEQLTGVAVVGVGLPQINPERDEMKKYFQEKGLNGYQYAYVFPGMNKVLQAGGRLIRTEEDTGILLLIDDRYLTAQYRKLLPEEWK
ncbi:helicase C-terminal domain-containing protein [Jeotgalibacillus salarius]|uniref:ATP-dependent DNA helicase n=1 Tax=Jeotgalibacillus salarius TaxID=546023 RepID=A0A4Y8LAT3_9BACL|nr:helicase C-terminal domain-containing protein [Jeotgalibacillus salarius]TFD99741.1 ATP-dependent DNA helicase [Jeotgalibacillus salarius]